MCLYECVTLQFNWFKRCVDPKAHVYTFGTCFVIPFWCNEERNYRENYTLSNAKDFVIFFENTMYSIVWHCLCPRLRIMCVFRNPTVLPEPKIGWQCQTVTFWTNPSILYAVTSLFVPLPVLPFCLLPAEGLSWHLIMSRWRQQPKPQHQNQPQ